MKFLTAIRLGFHRVHRRWGIVLLAYLAALLPALFVASLFRADLAESLDKSLFAARVWSGQRFAVWSDFGFSSGYDLGPVWGGLGLRFWAVVLVQILVSAGIVESLLGATSRREHPFVAGVGRHGWRFLRAALWFAVALVLVAVPVSGAFYGLGHYAREIGDGSLQLYGGLVIALLAGLVFVPFKVAYDLSRIAAAAHDEGSTCRGFLRALGHAFAHPVILWPLFLTFALAAIALQIGYFAVREVWVPGGPLLVLALFAGQQALLFVHAYLRTGLWASEIAYYQGIGEPRWCRKGGRRKARAAAAPSPPPAADRSPAPATEPPPALEAAPPVEPEPEGEPFPSTQA